MSELSTTVGSGFAEYFDKIREKLDKWVDPLSEEQFWKNPFPYGNDVGHLVLHLTGNLNYYIGAQIAANGYVRDRNREFTETARPSKSQVLQASITPSRWPPIPPANSQPKIGAGNIPPNAARRRTASALCWIAWPTPIIT
jgi:hypothetical protein